ncbi:BAH and coiled-coil domain-containing protein 1 [Pyxicephalus adspersus]|uniref:BAH and coiled-coil domain-containing protein 1 n=1 Tax=Pyxicephalus adspersus TaxID=30357 RepID=UPI003B59CBEF
MDGREFVPPPHLSHRGAGRMNPPTGHSAVQHPGHFQATKYFSSPLPMATHTASTGLMANSSPSFMGSFLSSSLGSPAATAHPASASSSPSETTYRGPHGASASQIWFSHSHEGYPRFSTFLPMSHLDHGNSNVLYGQHRFYESQKDNFYLRNLPPQPTLLSANHNFPSIARAAPGHPIGSCSRDRENSHLQKGSKDNDRYMGGSEMNKDKMSKGDLKDRHLEDDGKERQKVVLPMTMDSHCKEDMHQRGSCENRTKHLNSCLMTSKVLNGDPSKALLSSCTVGAGMPRQGSQNRCAKEVMRSDRSYPQHEPQQPYSECLERRQMLHHSVSYTVPSSLPSIPAPLNTSTSSFPCLQLHSNSDVVCSLQDKSSRELKMGRPTFVPSVGHFTDKSRPFQVTPEGCHIDRGGEGKDKGHEMNTDHHLPHGSYANTFSHLKAEAKGERRLEWPQNTAVRIKNLEFLNSGGSETAMQRSTEKAAYFEMPPSQDCPRPNNQDSHCIKTSQSCCTLDRPTKDSQVHSSQKVARIRHQQHRPSEGEQTVGNQEGKRKTIDLSSLGYNGPHLPPWTESPISIGEDRKNSYLDPFSTSLQQAALITPGPSLSQEMQGPTDEVSAMKNLLKYSNQALIVGQRTPFVGLGNMKTSCSHQENKFHGNNKCQPEQERLDCARSRENENSHGEGEVRQPPVGIAVAVARQKDTSSRHESSYGTGSSRQNRNNMGQKVGSGRPMHVIDLDAEEERSRICDERLGIPGRDLLMQENKDLVEFARIHPSGGCPGDLTSHLMIAGGASQLGADPTPHTHPTHPHWLPRTRSPSIWMGGHSYGISHPALHQNLPPGFPPSMSSAMQPVFPLSQEPPAQLVILPPEPSPHPAPHSLADVMDQASLWPPMYPGRGPTSHLQHPGQLPVYSRSQFLRQQELYALQQQRAAQALELQRQTHLQRKPEDHFQEPEDPPEKAVKPHSKSDALNSSKTPPSLLLPPPSAPAPPKLSPCSHSPTLRPPSKCPTPRPLAPCTLPACPDGSSSLVPSSPAVSPVPVQSSKGKEGEDRRGEGQPPRDYPKSLEPDLPPGYTYPDVVQSYTSPSPHIVHSADPADPETMQTASTAAEPEQSRTFTPSKKSSCSSPVAEDLLEASEELPRLGETDLSELCSQETPAPKSPECEEVTAGRSLEEPREDVKAEEQAEPENVLIEEARGADDGCEFQDATGEQLPNLLEGSPSAPVAAEVEEEEDSKDDHVDRVLLQDVTEHLESEETRLEEEELFTSSVPCSPRATDHQEPHYSLDTLIAAGITLGDLPSLEDKGHFLPVEESSLSSSSGTHGLAVLSELADLAQQDQSKETKASENESSVSDLQVFATIAAAWSLAEEDGLNGAKPACHLASCPATIPRVRLSRRSYSWTPKTKPVCPLKAAIDQLDTQEMEIRMKLAEIQRRYKEKQRELAKLQRRHDHNKEEVSRSPVRRGPGRPRKRQHSRTLSSHRSYESKKRKTLNRSLSLLCGELRSDGEPKKKKNKTSEESYSDVEQKAGKMHCKKIVCPQNKLVSKLARKVSQLKTKALASGESPFHRKEALPPSKLQKKLPRHKMSSLKVKEGAERKGQERPRSGIGSEGAGEADEDHDEDSDSDEGEQDLPGLSSHESSLSLSTPGNTSLVGPSASAVVKMEANQKAKKKIERQGLLGSCGITSPESEVKIRKRSAKMEARARPDKALKKKSLSHKGKPDGNVKRKILSDNGMMTPSKGLFSTPNQVLKKEKKNKNIQRENGVLSLALASRSPKNLLKEGMKMGRIKPKQERGRAVSRLLHSFAIEDDFQFDDNSSFSEGEEEPGLTEKNKSHICSLSKMDLREGLQVLIPKEDNLLYAASIRSLQPPDIYSVVIEGERGNRPRIYSQEQLLQEAVIDVRPQSSRCLPHGTRVCAYWSQKSRCLYPGNVVRGSSSDEGESDSVTVAFDDGDRGRITLNNIRLLPPDFTIQCTEPSPALLLSAESRRTKRFASNTTTASESSQNPGPDNREAADTSRNTGKKTINKEKTDKMDVFNSGAKTPLPATNFLGRSSSLEISWPSQGKRRAGNKTSGALHEPFQSQGSGKKQKSREQPHVFGNGFGADSFSSLANSYSPFGGSANSGIAAVQKPIRTKKGERPEEEDKSKGGKRKSGNEFLVKLDHEGVMSPKTKNGKALLLCDKDFGLRIGHNYGASSGLAKDKKRKPPLHEHLSMGLALGKYTGQTEYGVNCDSDCSYFDQDEEDNPGGLRARVPSRYLAGLPVSSSSSGSSSSSSSGSISSSSICSTDNEDFSESSDEADSAMLLQPCLTHPVPTLLAQHAEDNGQGSRGCFVSGQKAKQRRKGTPSNFPKTKEPLPRQQRLPSVENRPKISTFLPARQLWKWSGEPTQRRGMKGKARKLFYKSIVRGKETLHVGECAVFLSAGRPNLPYIGRIESMWESWGGNMVVKVKWFYHPEETKLGKRHSDGKNALYQSSHEDENDVQTISHKCQVVSRQQYEKLSHSKRYQDRQNLYYLAGTYDPGTGRLVTAEGVPVLC